ncbi:hypothetical protein HID58_018327 [Brassica napus]|uniref:Uncharacterized protein n=1 Tax=Brassica napus TaxID=3708 RepID=A0ABQ8D9L6_BRANA|nr:hypothetical protein HID58_018327 [Brassica napus]
MRACNPSGDNKVMGHWAGLGKVIYWPACSKSESGGDCVRLVSQSSVHLPLSTVEGLRASASQAHYDPISRL